MLKSELGIFAKILAHPGDAFALDDLIGVDELLDTRKCAGARVR